MGFKQMFPTASVDFNSADAVEIYTDGSCIGNGKPDAVGGWAFVIRQASGDITQSGGEYGTTNNRMEMMAVIQGLQSADPTKPTTVYSDSQYVINTMKGIFKIGKNQDLWSILKQEAAKFKHIQYIWVKGHADSEYNNIVDRLANAEATARR